MGRSSPSVTSMPPSELQPTTSSPLTPPSTLSHDYETILDSLSTANRTQILDWIPDSNAADFTGSGWSIIFHSVTHGCNSAEFHRRCDGKGPTLILVRLRDGLIIGGFTKVAWKSTQSDTYLHDPSAFLFSIVATSNTTILSGGSAPTVQRHCQSGAVHQAVCHTNPQTYGPAYGFDLYFHQDLRAEIWSSPSSYQLPENIRRAGRTREANHCALMEVWCSARGNDT